jgi:hypothetical protein
MTIKEIQVLEKAMTAIMANNPEAITSNYMISMITVFLANILIELKLLNEKMDKVITPQ